MVLSSSLTKIPFAYPICITFTVVAVVWPAAIKVITPSRGSATTDESTRTSQVAAPSPLEGLNFNQEDSEVPCHFTLPFISSSSLPPSAPTAISVLSIENSDTTLSSSLQETANTMQAEITIIIFKNLFIRYSLNYSKVR